MHAPNSYGSELILCAERQILWLPRIAPVLHDPENDEYRRIMLKGSDKGESRSAENSISQGLTVAAEQTHPSSRLLRRSKR